MIRYKYDLNLNLKKRCSPNCVTTNQKPATSSSEMGYSNVLPLTQFFWDFLLLFCCCVFHNFDGIFYMATKAKLYFRSLSYLDYFLFEDIFVRNRNCKTYESLLPVLMHKHSLFQSGVIAEQDGWADLRITIAGQLHLDEPRPHNSAQIIQFQPNQVELPWFCLRKVRPQ